MAMRPTHHWIALEGGIVLFDTVAVDRLKQLAAELAPAGRDNTTGDAK